MSDVIAVVLHTEVGTEHGTEAEFANGANQVSAHFGVGLDGSIDQFVQLTDAAWANGGPNPGMRWTFTNDNPNLHTVSIETEDDGNPDTQPVTDAQYSSVVYLIKQIILPAWPSIKYLVAHEYINPAHSCPAKRWLDTGKFAQVAQDCGLQPIS